MIQIDMPMPTNCLECPACNEYLTCAIPVKGRKWGENDVREFSKSRPEWCPLKEPEGTINELQNAYSYLQKQFFEAQDKLLKVQEHSEKFIVIDNKTGKEADTYDIALHEDWAKNLCYCDMEGWAIEEDGTLLLVDECGRFEYADRERFKVKWND